MTAHVCDECDEPATAITPYGDWCAAHLAAWEAVEAAQEAEHDDAARTTDYEDWQAAIRGRVRPRPDDGPDHDAYWEARIDEAREGKR
jgi:hypothetical protein